MTSQTFPSRFISLNTSNPIPKSPCLYLTTKTSPGHAKLPFIVRQRPREISINNETRYLSLGANANPPYLQNTAILPVSINMGVTDHRGSSNDRPKDIKQDGHGVKYLVDGLGHGGWLDPFCWKPPCLLNLAQLAVAVTLGRAFLLEWNPHEMFVGKLMVGWINVLTWDLTVV